MVFGNKSFKLSVNLSGCLNSSSSLIPLSHSTKLLGAHLDDTLSFNLHISKTVSSSLIILKNVRSIRKLLTPDAAETLIHSIITSKLDQCNSLLYGTTLTNIQKLQRIQNFALRTVLNLHPHSHVTHHYQELHWLTVDQRIHFKVLTLIFKCIHSMAPSPLAVKIKLKSPLDMLLDSSQFYPSSAFGKKAFSYYAPHCWNALPWCLRVIPCLDTFKAHLKHHLFTNFSSYLHAINPYTWFVFHLPFPIPQNTSRSLFLYFSSGTLFFFFFSFTLLCFLPSHLFVCSSLYLFSLLSLLSLSSWHWNTVLETN